MQKILVPVDGSESAVEAARFAARQARLSKSKLTLLYVADPTTPGAVSFFEGMPEVQEEQARSGQAAIDRAKDAMHGLEIQAHLVEVGNPADCILAAAERLGITHIIMGSRGLSPLKELVLGSVSDRVVRQAKCPVTIVR